MGSIDLKYKKINMSCKINTQTLNLNKNLKKKIQKQLHTLNN